MKKIIVTLLGCLALASAHANSATFGATVTTNGTFFTNPGGWLTGTNALPADLVDGVYQPEQHQWNYDSIWWNGADHPSNSVTLNLTSTFLITDFKAQVDNNDTYLLEYLGADLAWHNAWSIPDVVGYGLMTRSTVLGAPIQTNSLRFTATGGDGLYSVSEIEANGEKVGVITHGVPESGSSLALLAGAFGLIGVLRRRLTA